MLVSLKSPQLCRRNIDHKLAQNISMYTRANFNLMQIFKMIYNFNNHFAHWYVAKNIKIKWNVYI